MRKIKSFVGIATVGTKGQIVIPAEARQELGINEGDKLLILHGRTKKTLILVTHPEIDRLIQKAGLNDDRV
jgi:AbrB family looped-hinge helix DNA binding protein